MARISRRKLLKLSGAGAVAAGSGGMAAILASGRAPAYAQATTLHWLRWNDFVPVSDEVLRKEIAPACEKALGIKLNIEMINGNDIQARTTSAIQSGVGRGCAAASLCLGRPRRRDQALGSSSRAARARPSATSRPSSARMTSSPPNSAS